MDDLLNLYDQNLRINIDFPGVRKEVLPHLVRFIRPTPGMNFVAYSRLDENDMDASIQEQVNFFSAMNQPFSWHVCEHDLPSTLTERLVAHNFKRDDDPDAIMVLDVQSASPPLLEPPHNDVRRLSDLKQLEAIVRIEEQVWGGNFAWLKQRLSEHLQIQNYLSICVAYVQGQPVCSGWVYFHPNSQFASLYGGATIAAYRKRGLYTKVLAARVQEAAKRVTVFLRRVLAR